jgi:hypothetical protein
MTRNNLIYNFIRYCCRVIMSTIRNHNFCTNKNSGSYGCFVPYDTENTFYKYLNAKGDNIQLYRYIQKTNRFDPTDKTKFIDYLNTIHKQNTSIGFKIFLNSENSDVENDAIIEANNTDEAQKILNFSLNIKYGESYLFALKNTVTKVSIFFMVAYEARPLTYKSFSNILQLKQFVHDILIQIQKLHDKGYIHDDVKVANTVEYKGEYHLIDFGGMKKIKETKLNEIQGTYDHPYIRYYKFNNDHLLTPGHHFSRIVGSLQNKFYDSEDSIRMGITIPGMKPYIEYAYTQVFDYVEDQLNKHGDMNALRYAICKENDYYGLAISVRKVYNHLGLPAKNKEEEGIIQALCTFPKEERMMKELLNSLQRSCNSTTCFPSLRLLRSNRVSTNTRN